LFDEFLGTAQRFLDKIEHPVDSGEFLVLEPQNKPGGQSPGMDCFIFNVGTEKRLKDPRYLRNQAIHPFGILPEK
jgi:hypothetical protein